MLTKVSIGSPLHGELTPPGQYVPDGVSISHSYQSSSTAAMATGCAVAGVGEEGRAWAGRPQEAAREPA
ncbi:hypothetical protein [Nonomuraea sp. NPDC050783]|uniref:hypothetical protein n=1 Tax=Nonomuraea sp. NPDC050783 TaxID=3154634 RepID=UPI0034660330